MLGNLPAFPQQHKLSNQKLSQNKQFHPSRRLRDDFKSVDQKDRKALQNRRTQPTRISHRRSADKKLAILGWSLPSIAAAKNLNKPIVVVSLPQLAEYAQQHDVPFLAWNFDETHRFEKAYEPAQELYEQLSAQDVDYAIPIFEETVEWAGALNARFQNDPRIFDHYLLFRNKAMMKRRAHLGGLRVGVFEEGNDKDDVRSFFRRVNHVLLRLHDGEPEPIHIKALGKAGAAGYRIIRSEEDIDAKLSGDNFPCLMESHLEGTEISCEAFIYKGEVRFLNITEYVVFGYSMMAPPSKAIEAYRPQVREQVQKLADAFDIEHGIIHPEFFIAEDGQIYFGEVAYRIPGGHIFDLMQKTYDFNPFEAHLLCCDPITSEEELQDRFPDETHYRGHAGSFLVYPRVDYITGINIPEDLEKHPCFERHTIFAPAEPTVNPTEGYGNHLGTIFFYGDHPDEVKQPLIDYVDHDFYV